MSIESDKIHAMMDRYIKRMSEVGKKATCVHVTKKQYRALEADAKKHHQRTDRLSYKGLPIEIYE